MAGLWHELEVGDDDGQRFAALKVNKECGCTLDQPCQTFITYYDDDEVPGGLPGGMYVIRMGDNQVLEVAPVGMEG
jgi:hypothetical protein